MKKIENIKKYLNIIKWVAIVGAALGFIAIIAIGIFVIRATKDLPSVEVLAEYKPAVMTRVHAGDGKLITEYAREARVFVPIETIPRDLQHAFVSAEDQRFYTHKGWDPIGMVRASVFAIPSYIQGKRIGGTSTITQQVAKNFLVGDDYSISRKVREIFIARRIEKAMDKDHILELYLNEIYFGRRAYGIAAASLNYFAKPMKDLKLSEMTYLALLPKGPNNYRPDDPAKLARAINRRNYVLGRMVEDGYITQAQADIAKEEPLEIADRLVGDEYLAAEYFVEEARKQISSMYGDDELYSGGLSIRTTLDTQMQLTARRALRRGLEMYDRRHGYRGPIARFETFEDWKTRLADFDKPKDIGDWRVALVMDAVGDVANLAFAAAPEIVDMDFVETPPSEDAVESDIALPDRGTLNVADVQWAKLVKTDGSLGDTPKAISDVLKSGDIILVQAKPDSEDKTAYNLRQVPEANGALMAMDPHTGRVLALVGGYSFDQSQFNRATQAYRQPGSAFKPFVYAAALDNGFTPASQVLDAPFVIERQDTNCTNPDADGFNVSEGDGTPALRNQDLQGSEGEECQKFYKPKNYAAGRWYGLSTLRLGIEKSRNAMTVRLANDIGMRPIADYGRRFGIYDEVRPELAWALGAGETTLLRLSTAYAMLVNGGKRVTPTILDRVQDSTGKTIFTHDQVTCDICQVEAWDGSPPPEFPDEREQVIDPVTAYQMTFILKGVVDNGTGAVIRSLNRPLGGKTGTTNDTLDAWFMGFSPDLVAGVYVGFDNPRTLGARESGSTIAAPIFKDFMGEALEGKDRVPFRIPENVTLSPVNRNTGEPSYIGAPNFILEAFRPGTEPKLGQLERTIRVGSGSDTFYSGAIDNPETDDFEQSDDDIPIDEEAGESSDTAETQAPIPPKPDKAKTVEDDIDDGLY